MSESDFDDALPRPTLPATPTALDEPWVPRTVQTVAAAAQAAGWTFVLTRAIGPRIASGSIRVIDPASRTLALRCSKPGRRVVFCWRWMASTGKWTPDGAFMRPGPMLATHTAARARLKE